MSDYTPTTGEVRDAWAYMSQDVDFDGNPLVTFDEASEMFNRWLAEHERKVAERAWDECREAMSNVLTAPPPDLSETFGGQEFLATSIIATLIDEQANPYRAQAIESEVRGG